MSHRMDFTLTDEEYNALSSESVKNGKPLEDLLHEVLSQHIRSTKPAPAYLPTRRDIQSYLYEEGVTEYIPTDELDTQEDVAERQHLAYLFGQGKPVSEMVIEDRGPH